MYEKDIESETKSNAKLKEQLETIGLEVQEKNSTYKLLALEINQCKELARRVENDNMIVH